MSRPKGPSLTNLKEFKAPSKEAIAEQRRQMDAELSDNPQFRRALHQVERLNGNVEADGMPVAFPTALPFAERDGAKQDASSEPHNSARATLEGLGTDAQTPASLAPPNVLAAREANAKTLLGVGAVDQAAKKDDPDKRFTAPSVVAATSEATKPEATKEKPAEPNRPAPPVIQHSPKPSEPIRPVVLATAQAASKRKRRWIAALAAALALGLVAGAIGWMRLFSSASAGATSTALTSTALVNDAVSATSTPTATATATASAVRSVQPSAAPSATSSARATAESTRTESAKPATTHEPSVVTSRASSAASVATPPPSVAPAITSAKPSVAPPVDTGPGLPFSTHKKGKNPE